MPTFFVTGTDTGVGKTHASVAMLHALRARGLRAAGLKPVASGCEWSPQGWRNEDALALQATSSGAEPYEAINPYAFEPPIAPHIAAERAGVVVDLERLDAAADALAARHDTLIVEGAGGWLVPINAQTSFADWVGARQWPVVLVVGLRLGCINHALLSAEAIRRRTRLAGWIANCVPPLQPEWRENIEAITRGIGAPPLACLPVDRTPVEAAAEIDVERLISSLRA